MTSVIHQIYITDNNQEPSDIIQAKINLLREMYSDFQYKLYNEQELKDIIKSNFDADVLLAFDTVKAYAFKADLARYCLLYLYGGYYFDVAIAPIKRVEFEHPVIMFKGISSLRSTNNNNVIENNVMMFKQPNHSFLKAAIDKCVSNILFFDYGRHPLDITGPMMLATLPRDFNLSEVVMIDSDRYGKIDDTLFFVFKKTEYTSDLSKLGCMGTNNYENMWFSKDIFPRVTSKHRLFKRKHIINLFQIILGREPDRPTLMLYLNSDLNIQSIADNLYQSEEYKRK